jgi:hypothetical protein
MSQIGSLHAHEPDVNIVIYDLGDPRQLGTPVLFAFIFVQEWTRFRGRSHDRGAKCRCVADSCFAALICC